MSEYSWLTYVSSRGAVDALGGRTVAGNDRIEIASVFWAEEAMRLLEQSPYARVHYGQST
jgi:hypothetical protein